MTKAGFHIKIKTGGEPMIPTVDFYGTQVSRLILGDNPFTGHSYVEQVHTGEAMMDFYTADKCVRTLFEAADNGVNTFLALGHPFILRVLRQFRNEGGKINIIFQSYPVIPLEINIREMMACNPIGIYHQGGTFDYMVEQEQFDEIHKSLKLLKGSGVAHGFGTHEPETINRAEKEGWGVDFYMACLYNARKDQRGQQSGFITGKPKELVFYPGDPPLMYDAVQKAKKPCIAFKLFAGGQVFSGKTDDEIHDVAEKIINETYANIKPGDIACIGVFQKFRDELKTNIDIVKKYFSI